MDRGLTTGIVMVIVFIGGWLTGYYMGTNNVDPTETMSAVTTNDSSSKNEANRSVETPNNASQPVPEGGTTIDPSRLSEGQKKLLQSLGVDVNNLVITPEMVACAEAKVGTARLQEIQGGATPSFTEGAALVACYKS